MEKYKKQRVIIIKYLRNEIGIIKLTGAAQAGRRISSLGDRLGLDVIYVQAKRWQSTVGREPIQSFVGALAGKHANKGVFITTSDFHKNAIDYARGVTHKIILINGQRLAGLMIEYGVGVSTVRTIALKRVDSDYFEDA